MTNVFILYSAEQDDTTLLLQLLGDHSNSEEGNWSHNSAINMSTMNNKGIYIVKFNFISIEWKEKQIKM